MSEADAAPAGRKAPLILAAGLAVLGLIALGLWLA